MLLPERIDPFFKLAFRDIEPGRPEEVDTFRHLIDAGSEERRILFQRRLPERPDAENRVLVHRFHPIPDLVEQPDVRFMLRFHRGFTCFTPAGSAAIALAEPESLFTFFQREPVKADLGDPLHRIEDVVHVVFIAQAQGIEIVQELASLRRDHPGFGMLDRIRPVVGVQPDVGEERKLHHMAQIEQLGQIGMLDVRVRVPDGEPVIVLGVPDIHRDVPIDRLGVFLKLERPISIHNHVELVDLVVHANVEEFDPLVVSPQLGIKADPPVAGIPRKGGCNRPNGDGRPILDFTTGQGVPVFPLP